MRKTWTLAAVTIAVAVAACGSSSNTKGRTPTPSPQGPAPSRAQYISEADGLCGPVRDQLALLPQITSLAQVVGNLQVFIQLNTDLENRLRALPKPKGDEARLDKIYGDFDKLINQARLVQQAAQRNDINATSTAADAFQPLSNTISTETGQYGFKQCGRPVAPSTPRPSPGT